MRGKPKLSIRRFLWRKWQVLLALSVAAIVVGLSLTGLFQRFEWAVLDTFFRWRSPELPDPRIVVVTIDDHDITRIGRWPMSDEILAKALLNVKQQQPKVIGLDLYRDLPVDPGQQTLAEVFQSTPYLIGVQKRFGQRTVPAPPILAQLGQAALADLVIDRDGTIRRGLVSAKDETTGTMYLGLATQVAFQYLTEKGIKPEPLDAAATRLRWGKARFQALHQNDGGYVEVDTGGYQVLLNFRGQQKEFHTVSLTQVLTGEAAPNLFRDRIVLIGTIAESTKDFFYTPYDYNREAQFSGMPGIFVHANLTSQILSAVIDGRPLIQFVPDFLEWILVLIGSLIGVLMSRYSLQSLWIGRNWLYSVALFYLSLAAIALVGVAYLLFLQGWWIPLTPVLMGLTLSAIAYFGVHSQKLQRLAYFDELTRVANRRYFDQRLSRQVQVKGYLTLMLCDVDCFKLYNDTYGHPAGDLCLQKVAAAISSAVRYTDLVARYGGEEFAVILPHTKSEDAARIAERILQSVRSLQLPHRESLAADHVTLSGGVAIVLIDDQLLSSRDWSAAELISEADAALYVSKRQGRNQFTPSQCYFSNEPLNEE